LCESNGPRNEGRITHLTVYAPGGFSEIDAAALSRFNRTWGDGGHELQFVLLGIGRPEDFGGMDQTKGQSPILASSKVWVSRTPFVPTDHFHIRGRDKNDPKSAAAALERELGQVVRKELSRRSWLADIAQAVQFTCVPWTTLGGTKTTWLK